MNDYEKKVTKPHSNYVNGVLGQKATALPLFELILSGEAFAVIDVETFRVEPTVLVDGLLKEHQSDLLFSFQPQGYKKRIFLYLLFEHKSTYDSEVFNQLLRYQTRIYETMENPGLILPILFYHGQEPWNIKEDFQKTFRLPEDIQKLTKGWALNFRPLFINTVNMEPGLIKTVWLSSFFNILKRIDSIKGDPQKLRLLIREEKAFLLAENPPMVYEKTITYISVVGGCKRDKLLSIISEEVSQEAGELAMKTIAEEMIEADANGRAEGMEAGLLKVARNLAENGICLAEIILYTGLSEEALQKASLS